MFFSSLDQTVVSTAMPVIISELKGFSVYGWVFTAYMLASTVTVPIYGKLSDIYGRRPFYVIGLGLFMVGSVFSGLAQDIWYLIAARAVQGLGAGAMMSMPVATIGDIFNPRERSRWMGVILSTFGIASIIGPSLGGWITDILNWRWVFYINLPVAAAALIAAVYALPRVHVDKKVHIDWAGSVTLTGGLLSTLLAFTLGGNEYGWYSPQILGLLAAGAGLLALFAWIESRVPDPLLSSKLFRNQIFTVSFIVALLLSMGMFGTIIFLPMFVQGVMGNTAQESGLILTPMMLSFIVGSIVGGQLISRTGRYKIQAIVAAVIMVAGVYLLAQMGVNTSSYELMRNMVIAGIGIGMLMQTLNIAVQNAFPYSMMGAVNSTQQLARSLGGVITAPILSTVLVNKFSSDMQNNVGSKLQQQISRLPQASQQAFTDPQALISAEAQKGIQQYFLQLGANCQALYNQFIEAVRQSLASGISQLFTVGFILMFAALIGTLFLKEIALSKDEYYEQSSPVA
ncbi:MAG: MFS transporter [Thaumarchaeota archaeon]|nr:MFS transporter [Nitrososphaerota archaeon]MCL5317840.1 MFS transporter [Nitrososphaerota archaeon]